MTIAATIDLERASRRTWDIVVIGAGPAGSLAGRELARHGCTVLLIDRATFPRWKVCGCCLNGHALALLSAVGLGPAIGRSGAVPLSRIRLAAGGRDAEVPLSGSVSLSREKFDSILVQAAIEAGVAFLPQTLVALSVGQSFQPDSFDSQAGKTDLHNEIRLLELRQGPIHERVAARLVLAANGLSGQLMAHKDGNRTITEPGARIGAGAVAATGPDFYGQGSIFMACGREGYLGLVRLEDGRLNLAAALNPNWVRERGGPGRAAAELLDQTGWPALPNLPELNWRGTPALTRQARRRAAERLFLIGDAAGYIEPFTGEGMAWALAAGRAVTPLAVRAVQRWQPQFTYEWEAMYRRLLGRRQLVCRGIAAMLRSPGLIRTAIRLLAWAPALATPVTWYLGCGEHPKIEIGNPKTP